METISPSLSSAAIATILGNRLRQARLNANLSQQGLADKAGVSRATVVNAEKGNGQLDSFIALLCALGFAEQLDLMLPPTPVSPLQLVKLHGKKRQRASKRLNSTAKENPSW